ncbi:hypothetical protein HOLleu_19453 [Holothuria leucospilota]|uniref:Uncharacterized protein n=1 Tax=Holothuria leucospilota TaxID=206669 RepID=A0A9Q1BZA5_HOLLE|nr:hypothetical protein HOLleu_19453 [Holothuria leucospilota]
MSSELLTTKLSAYLATDEVNVMFALTEPEERGMNYFFYGMSDKIQIFQTGVKFDIPKEDLRQVYNPSKCTIPEAIASPKNRKLSVEGTILEVATPKTAQKYHVIGVDPEENFLTIRTECGETFQLHEEKLQELDVCI